MTLTPIAKCTQYVAEEMVFQTKDKIKKDKLLSGKGRHTGEGAKQNEQQIHGELYREIPEKKVNLFKCLSPIFQFQLMMMMMLTTVKPLSREQRDDQAPPHSFSAGCKEKYLRFQFFWNSVIFTFFETCFPVFAKESNRCQE